MSTAKEDGGFAFPTLGNEITDMSGSVVRSGMTLRDWFAGQAASTLMLNCIESIDLPPDEVARAAAKAAYVLADAMLAERSK